MSLHARQLLHHDYERVAEWFARPGAERRLTPGHAPLIPVGEDDSRRAAVTGWNHTRYLEAVTGPNGEPWCIVGDDVSARIPAFGLERLAAFRHSTLAGARGVGVLA